MIVISHDMQQHPNDNNDILPPALEKVSQELKRASSERSDVLASDLKARQRAMLIEHAERTLMTSEKKVEAPKATSTKSRAPFFAFGGFALAGALAVFALFITTKNMPQGDNALRALRIPAAHAQDAFSVFAENKDTQGVETDSAFKIESKVAVQERDLQDALRIVPPIQYELQKTSDTEYRIMPKEELAEGTVYKVSITTIVDEASPTAREFSWAMQTKETFRLVSSIPATGSGGVPVNTGIEFKLSQSGFVAPTGSQFTISPAVDGRFEIRGRTLAFVPTKPLQLGALYEVKLDKSFAPVGVEEGLPSDVIIRFETDANKPGEYKPEVRLNVPPTVYIPSGKPMVIDLGYREESLNTVTVTGYSVTTDVARQVMEQRLAVPGYAVYAQTKNDVYENAAKTLTFNLEATITNGKNNSPELALPVAEKGIYLVKFEPKDVPNALTSWSLVQVTDTAAYSVVDRDGIYVWAVNASTNKPLSNLVIQKGNERLSTDATGVARLSTPSSFSSTSSDMGESRPFVLLTLGEGKEASVLAVQQSYYTYLNFIRPGYPTTVHNRTMGFIRAERSLYRTNDSMTVFGLARDRDAKSGLNEVSLRITKGAQLFDLRTGALKIYQEVKATPDSTGRFTAELKWNDLAPGYYSLETVRDGAEVIASQGFEVREYIKPTYSIEVMPERDSYFMGETVVAPVRVRFFDGTPMANASFNVDVESNSLSYHGQIRTDINGNATIRMDTAKTPCEALASRMNQYCYQTDTPTVFIRPTVGEEAEQETYFNVNLYRSRIGIDMDIKASNGTENRSASGTITLWNQDLMAADLGRGNRVSQVVKVTTYPKYWVKRETGFYYNSITKLNEPTYTYDEMSDEPIVQEVRTDASGTANIRFDMKEDRQYFVYAEVADAQGQVARIDRYVSYYYGYANNDRTSEAYPELRLSSPKRQYMLNGTMQDAGYEANEEITATYMLGESVLDTSKTPGIFYVLASRGIIKATAQSAAELKFRFEDRLMPNAQIIAVTYRNGLFETVRGAVTFASINNELEFDIKAQNESYAPGATVGVEVTAKRKTTGEPVGDVLMSYAAVDRALLALGGGSFINPLQQMYGWVPDEILVEAMTHSSNFGGPGGAEMGGGGSMLAKSDIRTNLKDVAIAGTVRTDGNGKALITFTAPDNLTTWQVDVAGVSDRLDGGLSSGEVRVTKPIFVDVVMPSTVLLSDKPTMKLRAFGTGLAEGDEVTFEIDAPSLNINKQQFKAKAGQPMTFAIENNTIGTHKFTIGVITAKGSDGIQRTLNIVESHARRLELQNVEAAPGKSLPEADAPETVVTFVAGGRGSYLSQVYELAWGDYPRADAVIAQRLANRWLKDYFGRNEVLADDAALQAAFTDYIDYSGAIRLKQYGSADIELTSEIAATAPELLDSKSMAHALWTTLDNKASSRVVQVSALAGLAALGEPVLNELDRMAVVTDLTVQERLVLARGMEAAGNRESARVLLEQILGTATVNDQLMSIEVSKEKRENIEATADAAALAMRLADTRAEKLMNYVKTNWSDDAFPVLAKARFVKAGLATAVDRDIRLMYSFGTDQHELVFNETRSAHELVFTREELKNFRVTSVDGPVDMSYVRLVPGRAASTPGLSIKRSYAIADNAQTTTPWKEGDRIKITLEASWDANAQDGCYTVRDYLPANMRAIFSWGYDGPDNYPGMSYLAKGTATNADFIVCKDTKPVKIEYTARIIGRGSYVAEAPMMQHLDAPSISTMGTNELISVQ